VSFEMPDADDQASQIAVTLAVSPARARPEQARHKAAVNQRDSDGDGAPGQSRPAGLPPMAAASSQATDSAQRRTIDSRVVTRAAAPLRAPRERRLRTESSPGETLLTPELDQILREMQQLQTRLQEQHQAYTDRPRVRRLSSVAAMQAEDAAYLQAWREQVEAVGNSHYPEASLRYGLFGSLRLLVVVRYDGVVEDVRVLASSGYDALDEAAIRIVRMAAPFPPFPPALRESADRLEIIRTWQFRENRLSSG
jgi:protein TonB